MSWFDRAVEFLGSREWLLLMMIVIVAGAFMFPDYRMSEQREEGKNEMDAKDIQEK